MGLISTIIITNSSFLDRYSSDKDESYREFVQFLSEESALTKKTIAWFIGSKAQSTYYLKNNTWYPQNFDSSYFPLIQSNTVFKDSNGRTFMWEEDAETPFLIFYPSGQSSGGSIKFNGIDQQTTLLIDNFASMTTNK